jgi:hypothetical protein
VPCAIFFEPPGMADDGVCWFGIGSGWDTLHNSNGRWHAIYVNWSVYFGPEKLQVGLDLAARAAAQGSNVQLRDIRKALQELCQP